MKNKEETIDELNLLKGKLLEYKRNIKIGSALIATGIALDVGIANLHVNDITTIPLMAALVTVPGAIVVFNASDHKRTKKRINEIENKKVLKKEYKSN